MDLLVETVALAGTEPTDKIARAQVAVEDAFVRAQSAIVAVASSTVDTIKQMHKKAVHPSAVEVKFGLKFAAQGNILIAGATGEATLEVTLKYNFGHEGNGSAVDES